MPLSRFDEYLAHQTSDTFDHVATSDRNFYDRYYFNMHASSDELFVIIGMGQYPNLGVTDAFITVKKLSSWKIESILKLTLYCTAKRKYVCCRARLNPFV